MHGTEIKINDRIIYKEILYFYIFNHLDKTLLLPLCILESCNLFYNVNPKTNVPASRQAVIFNVSRNNDKKNKTNFMTPS